MSYSLQLTGEIGIEPGARLKVQAAITIRTVGGFITAGAEIAWTQEPDACEGRVELFHQALRDRGKNHLKIEEEPKKGNRPSC